MACGKGDGVGGQLTQPPSLSSEPFGEAVVFVSLSTPSTARHVKGVREHITQPLAGVGRGKPHSRNWSRADLPRQKMDNQQQGLEWALRKNGRRLSLARKMEKSLKS